jgi:hypothetical protein
MLKADKAAVLLLACMAETLIKRLQQASNNLRWQWVYINAA